MWSSLQRPTIVQPTASRLPLPPPRAISGASPTQNAAVPPQPAQQAGLGNSNNSAPQAAVLHQSSTANASFASSPGSALYNGGVAQPITGSVSPAFGNASFGGVNVTAPSDFNQRMLMDYMSLVQSQLAAMNQVVASTIAQNQALSSQNQVLFEELRALKHHVEAWKAAETSTAAAEGAMMVPTATQAPPPTPSDDLPPTAGQSFPSEAMVAAVAQLPVVVPAASSPVNMKPPHRSFITPPLTAAVEAVVPRASNEDSSPAAAFALSLGNNDGQDISLLALEVTGEEETSDPGSPDTSSTSLSPEAKVGVHAAEPETAGSSGPSVVDEPAVAEGAAAARNPTARSVVRPPGTGGRYVGPPRVDPYFQTQGARGSRATHGSNTAAVVGATRSEEAAAVPSTPMSGRRAADGAPSGGRKEGEVRYVRASEAVFGSGNRRSSQELHTGGRIVEPTAEGPEATAATAGVMAAAVAAGSPGTAAAAGRSTAQTTKPAANVVTAATEKHIRLSSTAAELRSIVDEGWLGVQQAVLAAQQLPRLARLAQERQQLEADVVGAKAAELEILALKELFLRLLQRFASPAAKEALRPAFLPNYLALTAVGAELHQPPSRAFAAVVRQLITQHVANVSPELAAAGVAAVSQLDGTVAPGVLERACRRVVEVSGGGSGAAITDAPYAASTRLIGWKAVIAAGQLAPLGRVAMEAARQLLVGAVAVSEEGQIEAVVASAEAQLLDAEAVTAAVRSVLVCSASGLSVPPVLLQSLEAASLREGLLAELGISRQLLLARALVAAKHIPKDSWLDAWEVHVVDSLPRAAPTQAVELAASLNALVRDRPASRARPAFVAAVSKRLLAAGPDAGLSSASVACTLALHIGKLATGSSRDDATTIQPQLFGARQLATVLLTLVKASMSSLDLPDLAALISGLSLLEVRTPADVWSVLLSRTTDSPAVVVAVTSAARCALEVGLPPGIKPAHVEHFLSTASKHVGELPAPLLVGLMGMAAAVDIKLRPGLVSAVLTQIHAAAATMGLRDVAFLFSAVDTMSLPLMQPLSKRPLAVATSGKNAAFTEDSDTGLTTAAVLRRTAETALVPEQVLAELGLERTVQLLEVVARLQQAAMSAEATSVAATADGSAPSTSFSSSPTSVGKAVNEDSSPDGLTERDVEADTHVTSSYHLISHSQLLKLLRLLQPSLHEASPQTLAAMTGSAAALGLSVPADLLAATVAAALAPCAEMEPMTWSRVAVAITRCEQLAGLPLGSAGAAPSECSWLDVFVEDMQRKMAVAPPAALSLTLHVLVAHGRQPSAAWLKAFFAAAMLYLEAPLPLTQAQATGAAAVAASVAAGRPRPTVPSASLPAVPLRSLAPSAPRPRLDSIQQPIATAFTPSQLAQLLNDLAVLQLQSHVTSVWLAAALRQVEGHAVRFTYRELAGVLYGIVRLGGSVQDSLCNQLFIVSMSKMGNAPPALLARTLAVAAAAEGRKLSSKWWVEMQKALLAALGDADAAWQLDDLCLMMDSVLAIRRRRVDADISTALASALAAVMKTHSHSGLAAAMSPGTAVLFVKACAELPQLGRPPVVLLEHYLSYSARLLAKFAERNAQVIVLDKVVNQEEAVGAGAGSREGGAQERRERKRARERASKHTHGSVTTAVSSPVLDHLPSAIAVCRMLLDVPVAERPAMATPWLEALAAAGATVVGSLPVSHAVDLLWLIAKLKGPGDAAEMTEALAARVGGLTTSASSAAVRQSVLSADVVVNTVWALQTLGFAPGEGLLRGLARALPERIASLEPDDVLLLLGTLSNAGEVGRLAVNSTAPNASPQLSLELSRYLGSRMTELSELEVAMFLAAAANLNLRLEPEVIAAAGSRMAAAATSRSLMGQMLFSTIQALSFLGARPAPDELEALLDAVSEGGLDGSLGGLLEVSLAAAALYDMGARPGGEWVDSIVEAVLDDLAGNSAPVQRPLLTARGVIRTLHALATRFEANYVTLALASSKGVMDDLEGQLAIAEGRLVPQAFEQRQDYAWMVPAEVSAEVMHAGIAQQAPPLDEEQDGRRTEAVQLQTELESSAEGQVEGEVMDEGQVEQLDPELLAPLELADIVMWLRALEAAHHKPPDSLWEVLERVMKPALKQKQNQHSKASSVTSAAVELRGGVAPKLEDAGLCELLVEMKQRHCFPSAAFLQDVEVYLQGRMPNVQSDLLAVFASHCLAVNYLPDLEFRTHFRGRVKELLPQMGTHCALELLQLLAIEYAHSAQRLAQEREVDAGSSSNIASKELQRQRALMQELIERTQGHELIDYTESNEGSAHWTGLLLTSLIVRHGLRPPHHESPKLRTAWLLALQAVSYTQKMSLDHLADVLRVIRSCSEAPQQALLADMYKTLELEAGKVAPSTLAAAAMEVAMAGFQPALAPTLPAKLAVALETRLRDITMTDPRLVSQLLFSLGRMGHSLRTEVLQAVEVLIAKPLAKAVEVLQEVEAAAAGDQGSGSSAEQGSGQAAASFAVELMSEEQLWLICEALRLHAYRPSSLLLDALTSAAGVLHAGSQLLRGSQEPEVSRRGGVGQRKEPKKWSLSWSRLQYLGAVLGMLSDSGVTPGKEWLEGASQSLLHAASIRASENAVKVSGEEEQDAVMQTLMALELWGHSLSAESLEMLKRMMEMRHRTGTSAQSQQSSGLPEKLRRAQQQERDKAVGAAQRAEKRKGHRTSSDSEAGAGAAAPPRGVVDCPVMVAGARASEAVTRQPGALSRDRAVQAGLQEGPVEAAEYREVLQGNGTANSVVEEPRGRSEAGGGGDHIAAAEALAAIVEVMHAMEVPDSLSTSTSSNSLDTGVEAIDGGRVPASTVVAAVDTRGAKVPSAPVPPSEGKRELGGDKIKTGASSLGNDQEPTMQTRAAGTEPEPATATAPQLGQASKVKPPSSVDAPSSRVSFRRLTPTERAAAGARAQRASSPAGTLLPPLLTRAASDSRTRLAISQLLELMPKSSRPPRQPSTMTQARQPRPVDEVKDEHPGDAPPDDTGLDSSLDLSLDSLATATARRATMAAASAPSGRRTRSRPLSTSGHGKGFGDRAQAEKPQQVLGSSDGGNSDAPRPVTLDPQEPRTWNLLDWELSGEARALPVVEPEVVEP